MKRIVLIGISLACSFSVGAATDSWKFNHRYTSDKGKKVCVYISKDGNNTKTVVKPTERSVCSKFI